MLSFRAVYVACLILAGAVSAQATDDEHGPRIFPPLLSSGQNIPASIGAPTGTFIVVRYLGYKCSHCIRQITYLNSHASELHKLGIGIIATSPDPTSRWNALVKTMGLDASLFRYIPDEDAHLARELGALRILNDTLRDMHATIVERNGLVLFSVYSDQPYMDVDHAVSYAQPQATPAVPTVHFLDRYLTNIPTITTIASASDGLKEPLDLEFNRTALHRNDLWVVTAESGGHAITIVHNAGTAQQVIRQKKDSRASHFMWRTMGIAMGTNGAFGTTQNGAPGLGGQQYLFMGPTLWSSDTAVFASRYQTDITKLASHLDMLHQSPFGLGIAHDTANVFWVLDAKFGNISRYDFKDPHEVGGTDHRDGIIRRYTDATITPVERGRPAHMALDRSSGLLYFINPINGSVHTLDTRSGAFSENLIAPPESKENYAEFSAYTNAKVRTVITTGLTEPVGMDLVGDRLVVGDRKDGRIHIYAVEDTMVRELGVVSTGSISLQGIAVGPDGLLWFVDKGRAIVGRLDFTEPNKLVPETPARVIQIEDEVSFVYTNGSSAAREVSFSYTVRRQGTPVSSVTPSRIGLDVAPRGSKEFVVPVSITDSVSLWVVEVSETFANGASSMPVSTILVPHNVRRAVVQDERVGTFDIVGALQQTTRVGYVPISSDIFNVVADDLKYLKTILWNSGSFGEINVVDDAIIQSLLKRNIEVFLVADDPLILRTSLPNSIGFFNAFGCGMRGADVIANDNTGQRVFQGVIADPVTAGMSGIDIQLPRLNHVRGGNFVPNVTFRITKNGAMAMMRRDNNVIIGAVRYQHTDYRTIILGVNASRFLDGEQRTIILDKGLVWLEAAANPDSVFTSVDDGTGTVTGQLSIRVGANPVVAYTSWNVVGSPESLVLLELYSVAGQKMATLYEGPVSDAKGTLDVSNMASGSYFMVARAHDAVAHRTIIVR